MCERRREERSLSLSAWAALMAASMRRRWEREEREGCIGRRGGEEESTRGRQG